MSTANPISLLGKKENVQQIGACMKKAVQDTKAVFEVGGLIREYHKEGNKNTSTTCVTEESLRAGQQLIDTLDGAYNKKKSEVRFFGQNISEAIHVIKTFIKG